MELRERIIEALGDDALTIDEIAGRLGEPVSRVQKVVQLAPVITRIDDRFVHTPALLDGTTWVVPVDADDATSERFPGGFLRARPHLGLIIWWLIDSHEPVIARNADGTPLAVLDTHGMPLDGVDTDVITGEPGWLDDVAGGWAAVTVRDEEIQIAPVDGPPDATAEQIAAINAGFPVALRTREHYTSDGGDEFDVVIVEQVLHAAVLADREAFRAQPAPPVDKLIEAAGLEYRDEMVAAPGFDWDAYRAWQRRKRLQVHHGLDDARVELVLELVDACELHAEEGDAAFGEPAERSGLGRLLAEALDDVEIAAAFTGETMRRDVRLEDLLAFAEAVDQHARSDGSDRNEGVVAVQVRAHTLLGDETRAAELLDTTVDPRTRHGHLLHLAAELAADRGRAAEARQLLLRAGVTPYDPNDDDRRNPWQGGATDAQLLLAEVEPYARPRARRDVGRNSPCPCGSGKKYKACHLGKEEVPLDERAPWLYQKMERYVRTRMPGALDELAERITADMPEYYYAVAEHPAVLDLALNMLQGDQDFLDDRGPFLPEDEQLLAAEWALTGHSVFEVEDLRRSNGGQLRLRDVATGDLVVVTSVDFGDQLRPGVLLLGRFLPVGDTHRSFAGNWPVRPHEVNALIDAIAASDVDALCEVLAAQLRPPTLTNTDGHPMEWHRIRWSVGADPDTAGAVLAAGGLHGPEPGEEPSSSAWTLVRDSAGQRDTVIATIEVRPAEHGSELVAELNSGERAQELDGLIGEWFPDAEVLSDEILDLDVDPDRATAPPDDPEMHALVEREMLRYEEQWLDEHIPALGGRTPRDAVQDPVGREQVVQLLASFPDPPPGVVAMSPARLRKALDL